MRAFLQWKPCPCCGGKHFGNIRAGETAIDWGSVYDGRASVDNTDPKFALIEAYAGEYSRSRRDAIIALVNRDTGKRVKFDRIVPGRPTVTLVQREGPFGEGRIIMKTLHEKHGAKLGKQDKHDSATVATFLKVTRAYCDAIERGELDMPEHITEMPVEGTTKFVRSFIIDEAPKH